MEKKWWYIHVVRTQLLLIFLMIAQPTFAKPVAATSIKKGKTSTNVTSASQPAKKSATRPNVKRQSSARHLGLALGKSGQKQKNSLSSKQLTKHAPRKTAKRAVTARSLTKKGKKALAVRIYAKTSRAGKARTRTRFAALPSRSRWRQVRDSSRRSFIPPQGLAKAETRRIVLDNNADTTGVLLPYAPELAPFPVQLNAEPLAHRINSVFVLPGEPFTLNVGGSRKKNEYLLQSTLTAVQIGPNAWSSKAPQAAGVYPVKISHASWGATIQLNVIVMVPFEQLDEGEMNGYRIGAYPTIPTKQLSTYTLPRGFVEVTEENEQTFVSPHFRLRQFLCKQAGSHPKYMVLDPRLLIVLETILKRVNEKGFHAPTLSIMSGYRTPAYNRAIGNATTYSRHVWGDAADIFIDADPQDGEMDDLNGDGDINIHDTQVLYDIVFDLYEPRVQRFLAGSFFNEPILQHLVSTGYSDDPRLQRLMTGGLARYRETGSHGPFVHVDVRGIFTRWGR